MIARRGPCETFLRAISGWTETYVGVCALRRTRPRISNFASVVEDATISSQHAVAPLHHARDDLVIRRVARAASRI